VPSVLPCLREVGSAVLRRVGGYLLPAGGKNEVSRGGSASRMTQMALKTQSGKAAAYVAGDVAGIGGGALVAALRRGAE